MRQPPTATKRHQWPPIIGLGVAVLASLLLLSVLITGLGTAPARPAPIPCRTPAPLPAVVQARDGYTLTVQPIYADANRVVFSTTATLPPREPHYSFAIEIFDAHLTDAAGRELPWLEESTGAAIRNNSLDLSIDRQPYQLSLSFATGDQWRSAALDVHLVLHLAGSAGDSKAPHFRTGPFQFDFRLPTEQTRRAAFIHQTVGGTQGRLTLERVIVTCAEARFFLHFTEPQADTNIGIHDHYLRPLLTVGSWSSLQNGQQQVLVEHATDAWTVSILGLPLDQTGPWTLALRNFSAFFIDSDKTVKQAFLIGPWIFHFTMPSIGDSVAEYSPVVVPAEETNTPRPIPLSERTVIAPIAVRTGLPTIAGPSVLPKPMPSWVPTVFPTPRP